ncbi:MAG: hypoxanthine phosphoribosyltransferase [Myxococcota bacterium]
MALPALSNGIETLITAEEIQRRIAELGRQIATDYAGEDLTVLLILKGSFVFGADLVRAIDLPLSVDFIGLASYGDETKSSGVVRITQDLSKPVQDRHVLVVEDIIDTGLTMKYLLENLQSRHPKGIKICSLLEKPARLEHPVPIDYLGFTIPDRFVVGYGLDYAECYRNLPFIGVMTEEVSG